MKKILLAMVLLAGIGTPSDAQILKKLGNALNKMATATESLSKVVKGNSSTNTTNTNKDTTTTTQQQTANTSAKSTSSQAPKTITISSEPSGNTANSVLTIDNLGIAGIVLGGKMSNVPKSVPGLYAKYTETVMGEEGTSYECRDAKGECLMTIDDQNEDGIIDRIYIMVKGAKIANTNIQIGAPFSKVVNTPGLKKTKDEYGNELYLYNKRYEVQEEIDSHTVSAIHIY